MRSVLRILACFFIYGCSRDVPPLPGSVPQPSQATSSAVAPKPTAVVFPSSTTAATNAPVPSANAVQRHLQTAPISALRIVSWSRPGLFEATLSPPHSTRPVLITLALAYDQHPIAHRRPLAYARMAEALGMHVVPATVLRRVSTDELGTFFSTEPNVLAYLSAHAAIQNDGTVDALATAPSRGNGDDAWRQVSWRDVVLEEAPEVRAWAQAVASTEPLPGENTALLRDYVEALVLDYLAGNIKRRSVMIDETASALMLVDNDGAFPTKIVPNAEARLLDRLESVVRFPRSLWDVLTKFDKVRAREVLMPGAFETWLLSPRTLMLIDERRAALLTLLEARIAIHGERIVLSL